MHFRDGIKSAFQSIFSHKLRTLLTLTGIIIGVLAVVTMFSSVYALKSLIKKNMEGMGWNLSLVIYPTSGSSDENTAKSTGIRRPMQNVAQLNYDDFLALQSSIKLKSIYGLIETSKVLRVKNKTQTVRLRAVNSEYFVNKSYVLQQGRYYNQYENDNSLPVAVLGYYFAEDYFGKANPLGRTIQLGNHRLTIVGVLAPDALSANNGMNFNNWERREDLKAVYVPLKYGVQYMETGGALHQIYVQAASEADFAEMKQQTRQLLLMRHNMFPNFGFMDVGAFMLTITSEIEKFMKKWNLTLIAIASISLIVGGIGLFSTLLISIQERMSEIGIRKSIGASEKDIFFYFIFEAVALALMGAIMGVLFAWLLIVVLANALKFPLYLPMQGVALGVSFSLLIGIASGIYPAWKAAGIDPIQAIYYRE